MVVVAPPIDTESEGRPQFLGLKGMRPHVLGGSTIALPKAKIADAGIPTILVNGVPIGQVSLGEGESTVEGICPPGEAGPANVTIETPDALTYTLVGDLVYLTRPIVRAIVPEIAASQEEMEIEILGDGFSPVGVTTVDFGGYAGAEVSVGEHGDVISCRVPRRPAGLIQVTVTNSDGSFDSAQLVLQDLSVDTITPNFGGTEGGSEVKISGDGFYSSGLDVSLGDDVIAPSDVSVLSRSLIKVVTSRHVPGIVDLTVTLASGASYTVPDAFEFIALVPEFRSITPATGYVAGGERVKISVVDAFTDGRLSVYFNGVEALDLVYDGVENGVQTFSCTVPPGEAGTADVLLVNLDNGSATAEMAYTYKPFAVNDECENALPLPFGKDISIRTIDATPSELPGGCADDGVIRKDIWYEFTPVQFGTLDFGKRGSWGVQVFGGCGEDNQVCLLLGYMEASIQLAGCKTYYLRFTTSSGSGKADISFIPTDPACDPSDPILDSRLSADTDGDFRISLSEVLRMIQFYNSGGYQCSEGTEDGFAPHLGGRDCRPHESDYNPQDWKFELTEILRLIQFYNSESYFPCALDRGEDGFCPYSGPE